MEFSVIFNNGYGEEPLIFGYRPTSWQPK